MNKTQKTYIKNLLVVLGCIVGVVLMILGLIFEWALVFGLLILTLVALVGYGIACWISTIVYRWRVMGATNDDEMDFFDKYWYFTIKDGHTKEKIYNIEMQYVGEDWDEVYRQEVHDYLVKISRVPRPKIIDI